AEHQRVDRSRHRRAFRAYAAAPRVPEEPGRHAALPLSARRRPAEGGPQSAGARRAAWRCGGECEWLTALEPRIRRGVCSPARSARERDGDVRAVRRAPCDHLAATIAGASMGGGRPGVDLATGAAHGWHVCRIGGTAAAISGEG